MSAYPKDQAENLRKLVAKMRRQEVVNKVKQLNHRTRIQSRPYGGIYYDSEVGFSSTGRF